MPWYKFSAKHGPGHQSYSEDYAFYPDEVDAEDEGDDWTEDEWTAWAISLDLSNATGNVERVDRVSEDVVQAKRRQCLDTIDEAIYTLALLENDTEGGRSESQKGGRQNDSTR